MRKSALRCTGVGLALLLQCFAVPSRALACVVGTGTGASCTESALTACLPGTVTFNCGGAATIPVTSTKTISADTTIDGGSLITISGGHSVGVFIVNTGVKFTVQNLTIANGTSAGDGGGIASSGGTVTVANSTFSGNSAVNGGGIYSYGTLTVTNSTFSGNSAGDGGGIYNIMPRIVSISPAVTAIPTPGASAVISVSIDNANSLSGFTIDVTYDNPTVVLATAATNAGTLTSSCFFVPNTAVTGKVSVSALCSTPLSGSGALFQITFLGEVDGSSNVAVTKCNLAQGAQLVPCSAVGGTIVVGPLPSPTPTNTPTSISTLTVTNSTFSGNSGGGISNYSGTGTVTNTIIANSAAGGNCAGSVSDGGHNIDDGTTCGFTGTGCTATTGTSFCNTNPVLDPTGLQNNGGPTQTIALQAGSPAINAGNESVCAAPPVNNLDQRGYSRPGTGATKCSIGAFEANSAAPTATPTATPVCVLDVDGSGRPAKVSTDVVYIARRLLGFVPVPPSFRAADPSIPPDAVIAANIDAAKPSFDVDQRGGTQVATDIVYIARRLLGFVPVPPNFRTADPTIPSDAEIAARIDALCP